MDDTRKNSKANSCNSRPEHCQRYVTMANRTICKKWYIKKKITFEKGVFRRSRGHSLNKMIGLPFKLTSLAVQPLTSKPLHSPCTSICTSGCICMHILG